MLTSTLPPHNYCLMNCPTALLAVMPSWVSTRVPQMRCVVIWPYWTSGHFGLTGKSILANPIIYAAAVLSFMNMYSYWSTACSTILSVINDTNIAVILGTQSKWIAFPRRDTNSDTYVYSCVLPIHPSPSLYQIFVLFLFVSRFYLSESTSVLRYTNHIRSFACTTQSVDTSAYIMAFACEHLSHLHTVGPTCLPRHRHHPLHCPVYVTSCQRSLLTIAPCFRDQM